MADQVDAQAEEIQALKERMTVFERKLDENTAVTQQVSNNTSEIIELFTAAKGAFSVLERLAKLARPIGYIAAAVAAVTGLWATIKGHGK